MAVPPESNVKVLCCGGGLDDTKTSNLCCQVGDSAPIRGHYDDGKVTCVIEKEHIDPECDSPLPCKVIDGNNGNVLHQGYATLFLSPVADQKFPPKPNQSFKEKYGALFPFAIISIAYLLFTITDGAVRMIVLLHAYEKQFTALDVAIMFTLYELAGVFTNLAAGMLGARWGIKTTLLSGLSIQLAGLGMLFAWQNDWTKIQAIIYVTASQMLCGIAKDLTKLGGKTVTKLVTPEGQQSTLFKLVSFITGWKNSLKGVGYFLGSATVGVNYYMSLGILCLLVVLAIPWALFGLSNTLGRARRENIAFSQLFNNSHNINVLSLSRVFLFGSRDMWFEVPLPFFLRDPLSGIGWSRALTGAFLAIFIIVYGQAQSWTPQLVLQPLKQAPPDKYSAFYWCTLLAIPVTILGGIMEGSTIFGPGAAQASAITSLTVLLYSFCILFAINSAIHSYLIVRYSEGDKIAMQVGVYYASNALGRLVGTIASGALYTYAGSNIVQRFGACLFASVLFAGISAFVDVYLKEDMVGRSWASPFYRCTSCATRSGGGGDDAGGGGGGDAGRCTKNGALSTTG